MICTPTHRPSGPLSPKAVRAAKLREQFGTSLGVARKGQENLGFQQKKNGEKSVIFIDFH